MRHIKKPALITVFTLAITAAGMGGCSPPGRNVTIPPPDQGCAKISESEKLLVVVPQMDRDRGLMTRLSATGKPLVDILENPANDLRACAFPMNKKTRIAGYYSYDKKIIHLGVSSDSKTTFHESFHAAQDINKFAGGEHSLTPRDFILGWLLKEATAMAYQFVIEKEADIMRVELTPSDLWDTSDDTYNKSLFNNAYNSQIAAGKSFEEALSSAGKSMVRRLLSGADKSWREFYSDQAIFNFEQNRQHILNNKESPDYPQKRREILKRLGAVSDAINLTPDEFLGETADAHITKTIDLSGIEIYSSSSGRGPIVQRSGFQPLR